MGLQHSPSFVIKVFVLGGSSHVSPASPCVFANALDSFSSPPVSPTLLSSPLLSLAVCLACDGPEAAMLSSPLNLLFPFSQAPTPLHSARSSSSSRSPSILLRRHPRLHALLLLLPFRSDPFQLSDLTAISVKDTRARSQKKRTPLPSTSVHPSLPPSASAAWVESAGRKKKAKRLRSLMAKYIERKEKEGVMVRGTISLSHAGDVPTQCSENTVFDSVTQTNTLNCNCPEVPTQQTVVRTSPEAMTI